MPVNGSARTFLALAALVACVGARPPRTLAGEWGGQHIGMVIGPGGAQIEYDCAVGTIDEPIVPGRDGRFEAEGTHTPLGGPEQADVIRPTYQAQFTGQVRGNRIRLEAVVETGVELGPFSLRRGAEPLILRCL